MRRLKELATRFGVEVGINSNETINNLDLYIAGLLDDNEHLRLDIDSLNKELDDQSQLIEGN